MEKCSADPTAEATVAATSTEHAPTAAAADAVEDTSTAPTPASTEADELYDPKAATRRMEADAPLFKMEIRGLKHQCSPKEFKKILKSQDLDFVRVKKGQGWKYGFASFKTEEECEDAVKKMNGFEYRGRTLTAKRAKSKGDPYFKRGNDQDSDSEEPRAKRAKTGDDLDALPPTERMLLKVAPLHKMPYEEQLAKKTAQVKQTFKRIARQMPKQQDRRPAWLDKAIAENGGYMCPIADTLSSPIINEYRNKCEFTISNGPEGEEKTIGFMIGAYVEGTVTVVSPEECPHLPKQTKAIVTEVQNFIRQQSSLPHFDRVTHEGCWRQLTVRNNEDGEALVFITIHPQRLSKGDIDEIISNLRNHFQSRPELGIKSLFLVPDSSVSGVVNDSLPFEPVFGDPWIVQKLAGQKFRVSPSAFFQVNAPAAEKLLGVVQSWSGIKEPESGKKTVLLDICCGTGIIGLSLAKHCEKVIGIELCEPAVEDANLNKEMNGIDNAEFIAGKAEDHIISVTTKLPPDTNVVGIVDPPRGGLHPTVIQAIRRCDAIKKLVYVSCSLPGATSNVTELCRLQSKRNKGVPFQLTRAQPIDLFPHTDHVEVVMQFDRETAANDDQAATAE